MHMPLGEGFEALIDFLTLHFSVFTRAFSKIIAAGIDALVKILNFIPPWLLIICIAVLIWKMIDKKVALFSAAGLFFIWSMGLWTQTLSTFSLVVIATAVSLLIGIPLGIFAAISNTFNRIITPVLDFMQTMPAFVYLIPAIPFFGLGVVSAVFATVVFSVPPSIRLTSLGIRQISKEVIEASDAFGSTRIQKLFKVQLPLAKPTIMAGVNQTIMLALSMVVIAAMIGAKGLGGEVWKAIQRLNPGMGFEAGLAVVILAMILDRITGRLAKGKKRRMEQ